MEDTFGTIDTFDDEGFYDQAAYRDEHDEEEFESEAFGSRRNGVPVSSEKKRIVKSFDKLAKDVIDLVHRCKSYEGFVNQGEQQAVEAACHNMAGSVVDAFDTFVGGEGFVARKPYKFGAKALRVKRRPSGFSDKHIRASVGAPVGYKRITEAEFIEDHERRAAAMKREREAARADRPSVIDVRNGLHPATIERRKQQTAKRRASNAKRNGVEKFRATY